MTFPNIKQPSPEYGYAVQGGLKVNLPQIAAGDVLWLQAAYAEGALAYLGPPSRFTGSQSQSNNLGRFAQFQNDAFVDVNGKLRLTEGFSATGAFLHYWTPEWRSAFFGSYAETDFGKGARNGFSGPAPNLVGNGAAGGNSLAALNALAFNTTLRNFSVATVGANLIWSPVRDLDIGVEALYQRAELKSGRAADGQIGALGTGAGALVGVPNKTVSFDDIFVTRVRVQRDF